MKLNALTLNTWQAKVPAIWSFLKEQHADIVMLQEVLHTEKSSQPEEFSLYQKLKKELGYQYASFGSLYHLVIPQGEVEFGNAILSKFPISSSHTTYFDTPYQTISWEDITKSGGDFSQTPMGMLHATVKLPEKTLDVVSVHGIWGFDGDDNERRLKMADTILEAGEGKEWVIVGGDFNVKVGTKTIGKLEANLTNVFDHELETTFNLQYKDERFAHAPVDMLFVSRNIAVEGQEMPQVSVSDHMPLVATLLL